MTNSGGSHYYWCLKHGRVETDDDKCASVNLLGPYRSAEDAREALAMVAQRNAEWDAEDTRWSGEAS